MTAFQARHLVVDGVHAAVLIGGNGAPARQSSSCTATRTWAATGNR